MTGENNGLNSSSVMTSEGNKDIVERLVGEYSLASPNQPGHPITQNPLVYKAWLDEVHTYFRESSREELTLSYVSEWILDNYYIIRQAIEQIHEDLPPGYYAKLPKLVSGTFKGYPRIYALVSAIIDHQNLLFDVRDAQNILINLQEQVDLTMGELWAVPIFLRYRLIEALSFMLERKLSNRIQPKLPLPQSPVELQNEKQAGSEEGHTPNTTSAGDEAGNVANIILSLRTISELDWKDFFDGTSRIEHVLQQDPVGVYSQMDFKSRDLYRKEIEILAASAKIEETALAEIILILAQSELQKNGQEEAQAERRAHIGFFLLDEGRQILEARIGYRPQGSRLLKRFIYKHASGFYFSGIVLLTFILMALFSSWALSEFMSLFEIIVIEVLFLFPAVSIATNLINWLVTLLLPPRTLPKLSLKEEIPGQYRTLIVVPALITHIEEVDSLIRQIEMHYLRNQEPGLLYALLTDFGDADSETTPEDEALLHRAAEGIRVLNKNYLRENGEAPFFFLHRPRVWNQREGKWMGWERKRGKLHQLNQLLLSKDTTGSFSSLIGDVSILKSVRYVITLDVDTVLPRGAARRMIGTLAHPLNRAVFSEKTGQVISGYTVLQPRIEISPTSATRSWFTRIFAGDAGLDLYTLAVSDTYQDLFGEGIFVGKGIYDVAAFERSVAGHIPENALLSHDLLEGLMGRAGLVTDVTMIEDYPPNYFAQMKRQRRWIRGDWQLLPWLLFPKKFGVKFSAIDRWKIIDNLRRSLLAPLLFLAFVLGELLLSVPGWVWVVVIFSTLGVPLLTSLVRGAERTVNGNEVMVAFHSSRMEFIRWILAVTFLPYEAYEAVDAILTTLYRLLVTRRNLLQWTTAAQVAKLFGTERNNVAWQKILAESLLALLLGGLIALINPAALVWSIPVLFLWLVSPLVARWIDQPWSEINRPDLSGEQKELLRRLARRTWSFFERYVGPEDHWLPPDHFQESPVGMTAHRTSPTNIGLYLNAALAAYDMGYIDFMGLTTRLTATIETLGQLERYRGHFINWYDTLTLQPLRPRYISTVDSGNLAASLIVTTQACKSMRGTRLFRWELWQGYIDTLSILQDSLTGLHKRFNIHQGAGKLLESITRPSETYIQVSDIAEKIEEMVTQILSARDEPTRWYSLYQTVSGPFWGDISSRLAKIISSGRSVFDLQTLKSLQEVAGQVARYHTSVQRTITELVPWIPLFEDHPKLFEAAPFQDEFYELKRILAYNPTLEDVVKQAPVSKNCISGLRLKFASVYGSKSNASTSIVDPPDVMHEERTSTLTAGDLSETETIDKWLHDLEKAVEHGARNAGTLLDNLEQIAAKAEEYVSAMDFRFLYHTQRRIFHIGYNMESGQLDNNFYDLLASEARITSLVAIALGEIPQAHWLHLSRPVTAVDGQMVLLSWSATMFEYLMPTLFLPLYPSTLLTESAIGAVKHQVAYGKSKGVPWGISESGFYRFDANMSYQYRAFGVPGLGFKRGLGDDLVIAPYASMMAVCFDPRAVVENAVNLIQSNGLGLWGFYEAIDFTTERLLFGETSAVVKEYMAHHQGMILLALNNYFHDDIMVKRMISDPRIQSVDLLLQEQVPLASQAESPYAEDVKGIQRLPASGEETITPWTVPVQTPIPQVNLLSNGSYSVIISNSGSGYSTWKGIDLTRWQPDGVLDPLGTWIYLQEIDTGSTTVSTIKPQETVNSLWSAGFQPVPENPNDTQVTFFSHMAVFRREHNGIVSTMEVTVDPDNPIEIRRININNGSNIRRLLRITSYGEVILNQQSADARHPAFNKLFIESEYVPELNLQIFKRRPRSEDENPAFLGHMLLPDEVSNKINWHEADRKRFIGRQHNLRNPVELLDRDGLSGSSGATLDPIFAQSQELSLNPHGNVKVAFLTIAGESREEIVALARRYRNWTWIERSFHQADLAAQSWLSRHNIGTGALNETLQILSALLYPFSAARAQADVLAANKLGQSGLWRFGISGDFPILVVELDEPKQLDLVREVLQIHRYLRSRRFLTDIVILNKQQTNYGAELNGLLYRLAGQVKSEQWLNQRGGIFILYADQMQKEEQILLKSSARVFLSGGKGALSEQMPGYSISVPHLPEFVPTREVVPVTGSLESVNEIEERKKTLQFFNGYGGFSEDGKEYVISLDGGKSTPAPWVNVIGYPLFGFFVTEAGSQTTWAINSGENRLTPWSNDPVQDPSGEALYLRDEETGEVWSPTPLPAGEEVPFTVRHGAGYSIFEHESHGLHQKLTLYASPEDPVKVVHLRVRNTWDHIRRITATQYVDWVLGISHALSQPYLIPEYDAERECLLVRNPYNTEFSERTAFLAASKPVHGLTADRVEFFGRNGTPALPIALERIGLETRISPGEDTCGVLQVHLDLLPGGVEEIYFIIGQGENREQAQSLVDKYHQDGFVGTAWDRTHAFWSQLLDKVTVKTPDPAANLILNRWLLYQALSCRVWGRTAFYQSSGAFGFRDQLQDVLALLPIDPAITRGQILNAASHQFEEGDVLHWWHPPSGRGVRTRFSDDLLWLPYVTALYIEATDDYDILHEKIPFLSAPVLKPGEDERYGLYPSTDETYSLFDHCLRAIKKGSTIGPHGLPLIGTGDWNDGFSRVGVEGKGESVWLAWFICDVMNRFANLSQQIHDMPDNGKLRISLEQIEAYRKQAKDYADAVEKYAWDGDWYRRAYYDDGAPLGSIEDPECKIDSIAQSWSVISGLGDMERSKRALNSVLENLVQPENRLLLLFTPPFDQTPRDPGYIKGYLPGIRENGGQYTHAAIWTAWAFSQIGEGEQAGKLFDLLNPIYQAENEEMAGIYHVEPYVICADIYSVEPYLRRGGWTWYTGSAAWMYRLGLEAILGLWKKRDRLYINPVIPASWDGYEIRYQYKDALYIIQVVNPEHVCNQVVEVWINDVKSNLDYIPFIEGEGEYRVKVVLGKEAK